MTGFRRVCMIVLGLVGWSALALQLYLTVGLTIAKGGTVFDGVLVYVRYFTILTNILVAAALTWPALARESRVGRLFLRPDVVGGITMYIALVSLVYAVVLRDLWNPTGLQFVADLFLHTVMPIAFAAYWVVFVPKGRLGWTCAAWWLTYPAVYFVYTLLLGVGSGVYPYPFLDVAQLGYATVSKNSGYLTILFLVASTIFIGIDRLAGWRRRSPERIAT